MFQLSLSKNYAMTGGKTFIATSGAKRIKKFRVYRWSLDDDSNPRIEFTKWISIHVALWCSTRSSRSLIPLSESQKRRR